MYPRVRAQLREKLQDKTIFNLFRQFRGDILDLGCGYGTFSIKLAYNFKNARVIGADINQEKIQWAKVASKNIPNLEFEVRDAFSLGYKELFDMVCLVDVLHHVPRKQHRSIFSNIHEALKPNGILFYRDIDTSHFLRHWNTLHDALLNWTIPQYQDLQSTILILTLEGFLMLKSFEARTFLYPYQYVICQKKTEK